MFIGDQNHFNVNVGFAFKTTRNADLKKKK